MTAGVRPTQREKTERFRALHRGDRPFVLANPFDAGSARVLEGMGFRALATTSGGFAGTLGLRDGSTTRDEALAHARAIAGAVDLPVSGDLENGFGHEPREAAETVRLAAGAGLAGCSIEDYSGDPENPLYGLEAAAARVAACADAARSLDSGFVLTARAENFLRGDPDLGRVVARLRAYEAAGADGLPAPGLPELHAVETVCAAVSKPVNFMAGIPGRTFPVDELAAAGVRRISLASSLYRAAMSGVAAAAREVRDSGTFTYAERAMTTPELSGQMRASRES